MSSSSRSDPKVLLGRWLKDTSATNHHRNLISKRSILGCLRVNLALTSRLKCIRIIGSVFRLMLRPFVIKNANVINPPLLRHHRSCSQDVDSFKNRSPCSNNTCAGFVSVCWNNSDYVFGCAAVFLFAALCFPVSCQI